MTPRLLALSLGALAGLATAARADTSLSGVCPDGSFFVVQSREAVPCANPHFAAPDQLPPVRPYLLPKPYTWYVDQEARNQNSAYNLVETAQKIRDARAGIPESASASGGGPGHATAASAPAPALGAAPPAPVQSHVPARAPAVTLADDELRDLVRLIALRQEAAPATFDLEDAHGKHTLKIEVAYSAAFEGYALQSLARDPSSSHVLVWSAQAIRDTDFHPNFFVVQNGRTFRPDPQGAGEIGFLLGEIGALPSGEMAVGYLVMPASFDPGKSLEVFWNDRSVETVLAAPAAPPAPH
ncbi:MAG TPA: hypothetical protein VMR50_04890 [Myxococcota bacterium]|nr:hypothetical protein [Myxococcota bacterium]